MAILCRKLALGKLVVRILRLRRPEERAPRAPRESSFAASVTAVSHSRPRMRFQASIAILSPPTKLSTGEQPPPTVLIQKSSRAESSNAHEILRMEHPLWLPLRTEYSI